MKKVYLFLSVISCFLVLYSCNDSSKPDNKKIVVVYSGQKIICENCGKIIKEEIDTLNVETSEAAIYKISEEKMICKECGEQIPTESEINIFNYFMREDIKRIQSVAPQKFTIEYDNRTAALLDKKIMKRWKISEDELTRIILKVNSWAIENRFLSEGVVSNYGLQYALKQKEKIVD